MRRALLALLAGAALAAAAAASAAADPAASLVTIAGSAFRPATTTVLVGERVGWRNDDFLQHQVQADDGSWGSDRLSKGDGYAHAFASAGRFAYYCAIHPFMRGEVDAAPILLDPPPGPVLLGATTTLSGRAQAGVATVALAREGASGPSVRATVAADGSFSARVLVDAPGRWVATAGTLASPPIALDVTTHQRVLLRASGQGVSVRTVPPRPGARLVVERWWRERFAWRPIARVRLDRRGRADVRLSRSDRARGRIQVVLPASAGLPRSVGRLGLR
jgi:plastocyanin